MINSILGNYNSLLFSFARVNLLLVRKLVFDRQVGEFEVAFLGHNIPNSSHVGLPLLFSLLLVVLEEVFVWSEDRQGDSLDVGKRESGAYEVVG